MSTDVTVSPQKLERQRRMLIGLLIGGMILFGLFNGLKTFSAPLIKAEFGADHSQQGVMYFFIQIVSPVFTLLATLVLRSFGTKFTFSSVFVLTIGVALAMFWSHAYILVSVTLAVTNATNSYYEVGKNSLSSFVYTVRIASRIAFLHFFFGVGSMLGPMWGSVVVDTMGLTWRHAYLSTAVLSALLLIASICFKFSNVIEDTTSKMEAVSPNDSKPVTLLDAFRSPVTWAFGLSLSLSLIFEIGMYNWPLLYLSDLYGVDTVTTGAVIMTAYFLCFSLSRLLSGWFLERFGYITVMTFNNFAACGILLVFFLIGQPAMWLIPVTALFISLSWPTHISVMMKSFRGKAATYISAGSLIASGLNALYQLVIGLINDHIGVAWGFRSFIVWGVLYFFALWNMKRVLSKRLGYEDRDPKPQSEGQ